jgi:hypothetical protein
VTSPLFKLRDHMTLIKNSTSKIVRALLKPLKNQWQNVIEQILGRSLPFFAAQTDILFWRLQP